VNQLIFAYEEVLIFNKADALFEKGKLTAICGKSGAGKSTLLNLMLGILPTEPDTISAVLQDGTKASLDAYQKAFAYVPQGNSVFSGTIAQNLRLVAPNATDEDLRRALDIACALDFVEQLPNGIHYTLGAGGRGISEGQAQRIAIARALLRRAPILLLDEATSALDCETEKRLLDNLLNSDMINTCILVTHRPSSADFCHRTYEIRNGFCKEVINEC
jgi:ABC-type bacteriocin/lantibiotic exporter with double-glycine peptidase domain